jgi:O-antigen/teichoic acid export membrane protein
MDLVKRRLLSGGAWALGGRITLAFIGLVTNALLARLLSPAELGAYFLAYSVVGVFAGLGALGLTKAVVRFVAESMGLGQYERTRRAIRTALILGSLGALAVSVTYLLLGGTLVSSLFDSPALTAVTGVTAGWIAVVVVQGILVETFRGFHDIRMTTLLGGVANGNGIMTGGLFSLLLLLIWLWSGESGLTTVMLLAAGSGAVTAVLAGLLLRGRVASLSSDDSEAGLRAGEMISVAWPMMVITLAFFALGQSSLWIAGAYLAQEDVALYGAAYRLTVYVALPLHIANMVAPPLIAEMYSQGRTGELQRTLRVMATVMGAPALLLLALFVFFGAQILGVVFGEFYQSAAVLLILLSLGQVVNVLAGSCSQALMMTGHQNIMMILTIVTGLVVIASTIWAVQNYGTLGVASAAAGGLILQNVSMLVAVKKLTGVWTHATLRGLIR